MAHVQHDNKLYIQGGFTTTNYTSQFNALDLSSPWSAASSSWHPLKDGMFVSHHALVSIAPQHAKGIGNGSKGYILSVAGDRATNFWNAYDFDSGSWAPVSDVVAPYPDLQGHAAVTDPSTGFIYIIGGYSGNVNYTYNALTVFDPSTKAILFKEEATAATSLTDVTAIWSTERKAIMTFGGTRAPPASTSGLDFASINEYDPLKKTWTTMTSAGNIPTRRLDHCIAASADGSKFVLFGGSLDAKTYFSTIYIFDVKSGEWTMGQPAETFRTRMACGFHSGQFIAWGGSSGDNRVDTMHTATPIVYDLAQNLWVDRYDPMGLDVPPTTPTGGNGNNGNGRTGGEKNRGPVIGGAVAGVVIVMAVIFSLFIFLRYRKRQREKAYARTVAPSLVGDTPRLKNANLGFGSSEKKLYSSEPIDHYSAENLWANRRRREASSAASLDTSTGSSENDHSTLVPKTESRPVSESIQDYARRSNLGHNSMISSHRSSPPLQPQRPRRDHRSFGYEPILLPQPIPQKSVLAPEEDDDFLGNEHRGSHSRVGVAPLNIQYVDGSGVRSRPHPALVLPPLRPPENQQQAPYRTRGSMDLLPRPPRDSLDVPRRPRESLQVPRRTRESIQIGYHPRDITQTPNQYSDM
ncbi:hypothetical protein BGZ51_008918 [Haplosporangium sp. Z 767]|nr:hypothetical protein BGZ51_008918 [Haplosporangium sp. Z 767]KAF9191056.1 hypothetical protein BGZ50_009669 [Haplosporangium sp. Z 11]